MGGGRGKGGLLARGRSNPVAQNSTQSSEAQRLRKEKEELEKKLRDVTKERDRWLRKYSTAVPKDKEAAKRWGEIKSGAGEGDAKRKNFFERMEQHTGGHGTNSARRHDRAPSNSGPMPLMDLEPPSSSIVNNQNNNPINMLVAVPAVKGPDTRDMTAELQEYFENLQREKPDRGAAAAAVENYQNAAGAGVAGASSSSNTTADNAAGETTLVAFESTTAGGQHQPCSSTSSSSSSSSSSGAAAKRTTTTSYPNFLDLPNLFRSFRDRASYEMTQAVKFLLHEDECFFGEELPQDRDEEQFPGQSGQEQYVHLLISYAILCLEGVRVHKFQEAANEEEKCTNANGEGSAEAGGGVHSMQGSSHISAKKMGKKMRSSSRKNPRVLSGKISEINDESRGLTSVMSPEDEEEEEEAEHMDVQCLLRRAGEFLYAAQVDMDELAANFPKQYMPLNEFVKRVLQPFYLGLLLEKKLLQDQMLGPPAVLPPETIELRKNEPLKRDESGNLLVTGVEKLSPCRQYVLTRPKFTPKMMRLLCEGWFDYSDSEGEEMNPPRQGEKEPGSIMQSISASSFMQQTASRGRQGFRELPSCSVSGAPPGADPYQKKRAAVPQNIREAVSQGKHKEKRIKNTVTDGKLQATKTFLGADREGASEARHAITGKDERRLGKKMPTLNENDMIIEHTAGASPSQEQSEDLEDMLSRMDRDEMNMNREASSSASASAAGGEPRSASGLEFAPVTRSALARQGSSSGMMLVGASSSNVSSVASNSSHGNHVSHQQPQTQTLSTRFPAQTATTSTITHQAHNKQKWRNKQLNRNESIFSAQADSPLVPPRPPMQLSKNVLDDDPSLRAAAPPGGNKRPAPAGAAATSSQEDGGGSNEQAQQQLQQRGGPKKQRKMAPNWSKVANKK
ncbi:unnamed protein product [Amoebophrya sp. A120]|nr:unnamed protein product [Amoebophrya sp. A120]|eukprot:GSA120T00003254001.1